MNTPFLVTDTIFQDVKVIGPSVFQDHRGVYVETYNEAWFRQYVRDLEFVQDDISVSHKGVLRGIHGDFVTWKLVQCFQGIVYNVIVDRNPTSPTFGRWEGFYLHDRNRWQLLIPPGFGNGVAILTSMAVYYYKQTTYYDSSRQFTIPWNDPELYIQWPLKDPILSERDSWVPRMADSYPMTL